MEILHLIWFSHKFHLNITVTNPCGFLKFRCKVYINGSLFFSEVVYPNTQCSLMFNCFLLNGQNYIYCSVNLKHYLNLAFRDSQMLPACPCEGTDITRPAIGHQLYKIHHFSIIQWSKRMINNDNSILPSPLMAYQHNTMQETHV